VRSRLLMARNSGPVVRAAFWEEGEWVTHCLYFRQWTGINPMRMLLRTTRSNNMGST
jgi:hypothetical protein